MLKSFLVCFLQPQFIHFLNMPSSAKFRKWLNVPDPSINHNNAREKHLKGSGQWLLEEKRYIEWKEKSNSFMWINGICECDL